MPGVTTASALTSSIHYQPFRYPPPPPSNCSEEIDDLASSYLAITEFLLKESSDSGECHSKNNTCSQQQPPIKKAVCCNKQDQATRDDLDGKVAMSTKKYSNERDASMAAADRYLRPIIAPREKVATGYQVNNEQLQQRPMSWPPATSTPSLSSSMHFNGDRKSTAVDIRMSPRTSLSATTTNTTRAVASILDGIARDETFDRHLTGTSSGGGDQVLPSICIIRNEHDGLLHYSSSNIKNQSRMSDDAMDPLYGILQSIYHAEKQMIRRMEARQSSSSSSSNETCSPPRDRRGLRRSLSNFVLTCKGNEKNKKNSWWFKSMIRGRFAQDKQSSDEYPPRFSLSRRLLATLPGTKTTRLATLVSRSKSDLQQQPSLSVHMQQSVYRMSHLKLANPQRPLLQQVMISNFMHWCLAVQPW
ncbi:hypothetical protein K492DRAFT_204798 [Lichtheimia hyalospora FSU 10163]|nr:hypothetical protein K492DRAFT_204798 [Lichtheimia hyalospora FSU 10163]